MTRWGLVVQSQVIPIQWEGTMEVSEPLFLVVQALRACQTPTQTVQPASTGMIFQWKRSIYPKQSVSFRSVALGTNLILRKEDQKEKKKGTKKRKKKKENFDKVETLHLGLSGEQCFKITSSPVSKRVMHCKTK